MCPKKTNEIALWISPDIVTDAYIVHLNAKFLCTMSNDGKHNNTREDRSATVDEDHCVSISYTIVLERHVTCECDQSTETETEGEEHLGCSIEPDSSIQQFLPL